MARIPDRYHDITRKALLSSAAAGPIGAFSTVADVASIAGIWGTFLCVIATREHVEMSKETAVQICKSALLGMAGYYAGCKTATRVFNLIPFAGTLMGMGLSALANLLFTYRFALTVCGIFETNKGSQLNLGTLGRDILALYHGNGIADDAKTIVGILAA